MGNIYTAQCSSCQKIHNFDVGVGMAYDKNIILNISNKFNLLTLYKERNKINILKEILEKGNFILDEDYGHKICICDTCKGLFSRFIFELKLEDGTIFSPKYKCHECRKKLRVLTEKEILDNTFNCSQCNNEIKFYQSGNWD